MTPRPTQKRLDSASIRALAHPLRNRLVGTLRPSGAIFVMRRAAEIAGRAVVGVEAPRRPVFALRLHPDFALGAVIVVDGADKLRDGAKINLRNEAVGTPAQPQAGGKKQNPGKGQKQ